MGPRAGIVGFVGWSFYDARELMESFPEEKKSLPNVANCIALGEIW